MSKNYPKHLSKTELKLLMCLLNNQGKILTRGEILKSVWSYSPKTNTRVVDVYVGYLRKKIGKDIIESIRGIGYTIRPNKNIPSKIIRRNKI